MANVKVLIAEKDGQELDGPVEWLLKAEDVPFNSSGTSIQANSVQGAILEAGKSTTNLSFDNFPVQTSSYIRVGSVIFRGTANQSPPTYIKVAAYCSSGVSAQIRVLDTTNNMVIAEGAAFSDTTETVLDLGTLSNLPAQAAVFEIQMRRTVGNGTAKAFITSFQMGA